MQSLDISYATSCILLHFRSQLFGSTIEITPYAHKKSYRKVNAPFDQAGSQLSDMAPGSALMENLCWRS